MSRGHDGRAERPATGHGQPLAPARHRRGVSLVELLAAMAAASVVMATATALVHKTYQLESRSRVVRADEQTALRLARQFRTDVHEARSTTLTRDSAGDAPLVALTGPIDRIDYRAHKQGLIRTVAPASGPPTREEFLFSRPIVWAAEAEGSLVTLSGRSADDGHRPQLAIDVAAAAAHAATLGREPGASP